MHAKHNGNPEKDVCPYNVVVVTDAPQEGIVVGRVHLWPPWPSPLTHDNMIRGPTVECVNLYPLIKRRHGVCSRLVTNNVHCRV